MSTIRERWFSTSHPKPDAALRIYAFPHGGGSERAFAEWEPLLPARFELSVLSLPGRGRRHGEPGVASFDALCPALAGALLMDRPFAFFGHSVGAVVAFALAEHLERRRLPAPLRVIASAHEAPRAGAAPAPATAESDGDLLAMLRGLGMVPAEALADEALRARILPPTRSDFALARSLDWGGAPIASALAAWGGVAIRCWRWRRWRVGGRAPAPPASRPARSRAATSTCASAWWRSSRPPAR